MVFWILTCLGLYLFNVYAAGAALMLRIGPAAYMGPRDRLPEAGVIQARLQRAATNFLENLPVFLALALVALIVDGADIALAETGAMVFVLARAVFISVYVAGVPYIRSVVFTTGLFGLGMMAMAVV
ncbi:MAPEG family protein [Roseovarius aestuariivivens]|uniref:MAPEG family protein n=1 Tax=Roseovarius aestuariivivens TaxID=1888910 RepID=UPI0010819DB5|nr:MAPEG family protein [Roseovarius aestuariivivens]